MGDKQPAPPKARKLPFKPTALRKASSESNHNQTKTKDGSAEGQEHDGLSLFRRAKDMAPKVQAEQERRMRKRKRRDEAELRQRQLDSNRKSLEIRDEKIATSSPKEASSDARSTASPIASDSARTPRILSTPTPPPSKRERSQSNLDPSFEPSGNANLSQESPSATSRHLRNRPAPPTNVISLDSDSDEDVKVAPASQLSNILRRRSPSLDLTAAPEEEEVDDDFAEYIQRAREQRALHLQQSQASNNTNSSGSNPSSQVPRAIAEIVVMSAIEGSEPILVKFTYDKQLRIVRDSWIALQRRKNVSLSIQNNNDIVLTWNRQKAYSYSTLRDLGIHPSEDVDIFASETTPVKAKRIHLEAWTTELFAKMEEEEELRRKRAAGELSEPEIDEYDLAAAAATGIYHGKHGVPPPEQKVKIVLKPRDLKELKLAVRPETNVFTLIAAFRHERQVPPETEISLWFDGEKMEDEATIESAEIDDMDTIEVHIKE